MNSLFLMGGLGAALIVALFFLKRAAVGQGKAEGRLEGQVVIAKEASAANEKINEENKAVLQQVEEVHEIHDRLESDPAYRDGVRSRFTRPD